MRIGHGYDVHRFCAGDFLILGGVNIPFEKSFEAHSDGDVLLHALADALLGACALGDIGHLFPDTDAQFKGANSRELLRIVYQKVNEAGFALTNADITVAAQAPKLAPHLIAMRENIAADLQVEINRISVKATTTEKLGFVGRGEGIEAHAVVLLESLT